MFSGPTVLAIDHQSGGHHVALRIFDPHEYCQKRKFAGHLASNCPEKTAIWILVYGILRPSIPSWNVVLATCSVLLTSTGAPASSPTPGRIQKVDPPQDSILYTTGVLGSQLGFPVFGSSQVSGVGGSLVFGAPAC